MAPPLDPARNRIRSFEVDAPFALRGANESAEQLPLGDLDGFYPEAISSYREGLKKAGRNTNELPIRLAEFTRAFYIGGTENQFLEILRGLPSHYQVRLGALEAVGPLLESVRSLGFEPKTFPRNGAFLSPRTVVQIGRIAGWLRRERVELVHVHDFTGTLFAVPAAKLAGSKVVVSRLDLARDFSPAQYLALKQLTRAADHVIVNAEAIRRMLVEVEGIPSARISLVHNGIDLPRFDERAARGLSAPLPDTGGEPVLVHVANMNPVKRHEDLIRALASLHRSGRRLHAFLIGDGPRRKELQQVVDKLGLTNRVHLLGHRKDVPAILARATLGVLCSASEGLSNAIIEGMGAGLPMVVTNVGGNPELVGDGMRGWVVPPSQPEALARAIGEVLADPAHARTVGARARIFVQHELTLERMVRGHDAVYQHVCSST